MGLAGAHVDAAVDNALHMADPVHHRDGLALLGLDLGIQVLVLRA